MDLMKNMPAGFYSLQRLTLVMRFVSRFCRRHPNRLVQNSVLPAAFFIIIRFST
jgi:hypothetical protein